MAGQPCKGRALGPGTTRTHRCRRFLVLAIVVAFIGCGRSSCLGPDDRELAAAVSALVRGDEPAADQAQQELVRAGRRSIAILETGLYSASAAGRVRVVRALVLIGGPDVLPILRYLGRRDPSARVRDVARRGLVALGARPPADAAPAATGSRGRG